MTYQADCVVMDIICLLNMKYHIGVGCGRVQMIICMNIKLNMGHYSNKRDFGKLNFHTFVLYFSFIFHHTCHNAISFKRPRPLINQDIYTHWSHIYQYPNLGPSTLLIGVISDFHVGLGEMPLRSLSYYFLPLFC